jgi:hypothetical protein
VDPFADPSKGLPFLGQSRDPEGPPM